MELKILSHACMLIKTDTHSVIVDPWLLGSCYWRSWWNFPKASFDQTEVESVDAVVISHVHWDHWHGPTLRRFFKNKEFIIPDEPSGRSYRDLVGIGVRQVRRIPHSTEVRVGDIRIWLYQFGLFLNDAAIVIEADGIKVLNANDAKIAGLALSHLLRRHGGFDFVLRSHSSANSRVCFKLTGDDSSYISDDREHYFRSFEVFMDVVRPRYAIPFASNHCHLHDDVFEYNRYISNPKQLSEYITNGPPKSWNLKVMLPGSSWSSKTGFSEREDNPFIDISWSLSSYREEVSGTLENYQAREEGVEIADSMIRRLYKLIECRPMRWRQPLKVALSARWPSGRIRTWEILGGKTVVINEIRSMSAPEPGLPLIVMPAIVLRDAIIQNMFHHAGISKRCQFLASSQEDLSTLERFFRYLELVELGVFPLKKNYVRRMVLAYLRRWREIFTYGHAFLLVKVTRKPLYLVEEMILRRMIRRPT